MDYTYALLDSGDFKKLEQVGPVRLVRPSPGAVWAPSLSQKVWTDVDAEFIRKSDGKGYWKVHNRKIPEQWQVKVENIILKMMRTNFGHLGMFVEQSDNWAEFEKLIKNRKAVEYKVLNLFAYTGGASIACAKSGALVTHVDASKTSNLWAGENAELNNVNDKIRFITEDVKAFIAREIRRENKYQAIILDPPSFGRGVKGQVWKIEEDMIPLLSNLKELMSNDFHFISLSSHSPGYTPISLKNLLSQICDKLSGTYREREMIVPFENGQLPAGTTCIFETKNN